MPEGVLHRILSFASIASKVNKDEGVVQFEFKKIGTIPCFII
jgi:hypothetical protein